MDPTLRELCVERYNPSGDMYFKVDPVKAAKIFFARIEYDEATLEDITFDHDIPRYWVLPGYNKDTHKDLKLLTISDDLDIEYPEELYIHSLHRFSGKMAPLKGVKKLHLGEVRNSLDFTNTGMTHLIIERMELQDDPKEVSDYAAVFGMSGFALEHRNPPCTIKCNGTIEVRYSNPGGTGEHGNGLIYDCPRLTVSSGRDRFTSTCSVLVIRGDEFHGDPATFNLPNLVSVVREKEKK